MSLHAAIICHDDSIYLESVIHSLSAIQVTVFVNEVAWDEAEAGDWGTTVARAEQAGADVKAGRWANEAEHRQAVLNWALDNQIPNLLIPDSDEIVSSELLQTLKKIAEVGLADVVYCTMDTYWKSPEYVIRPREKLMPAILLQPSTVQHVRIREFQGKKPLMLSEEHGVLHHLSYAGPDARIRRKLETWSHKLEVVPNWYRDVWSAWDRDRCLGNLHPTHPFAYGFASRTAVPPELSRAWEAYLAASGGNDPLHPADGAPKGPKVWPRLSVIIPL